MAGTKKATALEHLKAVAMRTRQEIANLAGLVVDAVETEFLTVNIPTSAWEGNSDAVTLAAGFAYTADAAVEGATAADGVDAVLQAGSLSAASTAGMANMAAVVAGAVRFYTVTVPESALTLQVQIIKGK